MVKLILKILYNTFFLFLLNIYICNTEYNLSRPKIAIQVKQLILKKLCLVLNCTYSQGPGTK